jgi:hypothetical protein
MSEWVQSKYSHTAKKWKVLGARGSYWVVQRPDDEDILLLKSEYILCDPPDRWEDWIDHVALIGDGASLVIKDGPRFDCPYDFRFVFHRGLLSVERKVS